MKLAREGTVSASFIRLALQVMINNSLQIELAKFLQSPANHQSLCNIQSTETHHPHLIKKQQDFIIQKILDYIQIPHFSKFQFEIIKQGFKIDI